jgi:hypothetical protein
MSLEPALEFQPGTGKFADWSAKKNLLKYDFEIPAQLMPAFKDEPPESVNSRLEKSQLKNSDLLPPEFEDRKVVWSDALESERAKANASRPFEVAFGTDYGLEGSDEAPNRISLNPLYLGKHVDGWEIAGLIHNEDWFYAVGAFEAKHPEFGVVYGDFEKTVKATSAKGFFEFIAAYPPIVWDSNDS